MQTGSVHHETRFAGLLVINPSVSCLMCHNDTSSNRNKCFRLKKQATHNLYQMANKVPVLGENCKQ